MSTKSERFQTIAKELEEIDARLEESIDDMIESLEAMLRALEAVSVSNDLRAVHAHSSDFSTGRRSSEITQSHQRLVAAPAL